VIGKAAIKATIRNPNALLHGREGEPLRGGLLTQPPLSHTVSSLITNGRARRLRAEVFVPVPNFTLRDSGGRLACLRAQFFEHFCSGFSGKTMRSEIKNSDQRRGMAMIAFAAMTMRWSHRRLSIDVGPVHVKTKLSAR